MNFPTLSHSYSVSEIISKLFVSNDVTGKNDVSWLLCFTIFGKLAHGGLFFIRLETFVCHEMR
jgi:hypothetical protein